MSKQVNIESSARYHNRQMHLIREINGLQNIDLRTKFWRLKELIQAMSQQFSLSEQDQALKILYDAVISADWLERDSIPRRYYGK